MSKLTVLSVLRIISILEYKVLCRRGQRLCVMLIAECVYSLGSKNDRRYPSGEGSSKGEGEGG